MMTILTDEVKVVCPRCNKHFRIRVNEYKQGAKS
jgi:ribosomal protein L44E